MTLLTSHRTITYADKLVKLALHGRCPRPCSRTPGVHHLAYYR